MTEYVGAYTDSSGKVRPITSSHGVRSKGSMSRRRSTKVRIGPLKRGGLHGWFHAQPEEQRHQELSEAVKRDGYATVERRLNALTVVDKYQNPRVAEVATQDKHWLERENR